MYKNIIDFFDKFEDKIRRKLSRRPILYGFIGGTGIILFWRGIWHTMDFLTNYYFSASLASSSANEITLIWWDGPLSIALGFGLLLATGIFTSSFIGNEIIISGIKGEKKMVEKTEMEILKEAESVEKIKKEIETIFNNQKDK